MARHPLEPGLRQQQGAVAVAEYSQEEVGTVEQKAIFMITFAIVTRENYNIIGGAYVNVNAMCQCAARHWLLVRTSTRRP